MSSSIPVCATCGHQHECGIKCSICGHVGRSMIFQKMKTKSDQRMRSKITIFTNVKFDLDTAFTISPLDIESLDIIGELRNAANADPITAVVNVLRETDFDSNHVVFQVGDAFAGMLRFRYIEDKENGKVNVLLDNAGVLPRYRRQSILYNMMLCALQITIKILQQRSRLDNNDDRLNFGLERISISLPIMFFHQNHWLCTKLQSFGFQIEGQQQDNIMVSYFVENMNHLQQILEYISSRISNFK